MIRTRISPRPSRLAALLLALLPAGAAAQTVSGVVIEEATGIGIEGAELRLVHPDGQVLDRSISDEDGGFLLDAPGSGVYSIEASRLGYALVRADSLEVGPGERVTLEVRMAVEAIPVDPVVVKSRDSYLNQDIRSFYQRLERGRRSGMGHFVSRADIERRHPLDATDLLRTMPGVRIVRSRRGFTNGVRMSANCIPAIYVDGSWVNRYGGDSLDDYVAALNIEGIEVYRGAGTQVGPYYDPRGCGLILVWTRRGTYIASDEPFPWVKFGVGMGLIGLILLLR